LVFFKKSWKKRGSSEKDSSSLSQRDQLSERAVCFQSFKEARATEMICLTPSCSSKLSKRPIKGT